MSVRAKSKSDYFIRGSEVWHSKLAMGLKSVGWIALSSLAAGWLTVFVWLLIFFNAAERTVFWYYRLASVETFVNLGWVPVLARRIELPGVDPVVLLPYAVVQVTQDLYDKTFGMTWGGALIAGALVAGLAAAKLVKFYTGFGQDRGEDEVLRGSSLVDRDALAELVINGEDGAGQYTLAGVPIPAGTEMQNILGVGAMGTGKTVMMTELADQVFARGKKSIVWDKTGELTELYFRPDKDVILNPFDKRYPGWNIFTELKMVYEFEQIAYSICPDPDDGTANSRYFAAGARTVLSSVLRKLWHEGKRSTADAVDILLTLSAEELAAYLAGTEASSYISVKAAEQAGGVMSTLTGAIQFLKHVPDGGFSIREWVQRDDDSRLFITSHETVHDVLRPLVAMYLDLAVRATMTREKTREDRLWIWLDEMSSLGNIPVLKTSLTEARKYGVVHVIGLQNDAQLKAVFGQHHSRTIRSNLQTYVVFRVAEEETQEAMSRLLGGQEVDEQAEGLSFGTATSRDGSSVQTSRREKRIVLPSEIKMLRKCEGFLQLAGPYPVARVRFERKTRELHEPAFLVRDDLFLAAIDAAPAPAAKPQQPAKPVRIESL